MFRVCKVDPWAYSFKRILYGRKMHRGLGWKKYCLVGSNLRIDGCGNRFSSSGRKGSRVGSSFFPASGGRLMANFGQGIWWKRVRTFS